MPAGGMIVTMMMKEKILSLGAHLTVKKIVNKSNGDENDCEIFFSEIPSAEIEGFIELEFQIWLNCE